MNTKGVCGEIELRIGESLRLKVRSGEKLIDICDRTVTPIAFSCRSASCGTCAVAVLRGMESLSPRSEREQLVVDDLERTGPNVRLACQVRIFGPVHVTPVG